MAQSVGGSGNGGAGVANIAGVVPAVAVAIGGQGAIGGTGGSAAVNNVPTSQIITYGADSYGIVAQSVGGGGGTGGISAARAVSFSLNKEVPAVSVSVSLGGSGGSGNSGGSAWLTNSGVITTAGEGAYALLAQSVGGGGGAGGDSTAVSYSGGAGNSDAGVSVSAALAIGGRGGQGGVGGPVTLSKSGLVFTLGTDAIAMFGQSVGGGGVGDASAVTNDAKTSVGVAIGVGGSGGTGGGATLNSSGGIITRGDGAHALFTQSVGGGGSAGKGGSTAGGIDNIVKSQVLFDTLSAGLNVDASVTNIGDGIFKVLSYDQIITKQASELEALVSQLAGNNTARVVKNLDISVAVGGQGGAAGRGGDVQLTNSGQISTFGAQSDGIYAQSVSGGKGGNASSTGSSYDDTRNQIAIGAAGPGGNAGAGGAVTVTNAAGAQITTRGVLAFGIMGQSSTCSGWRCACRTTPP